MRLEDLKPGASVRGILPNGLVTVISTHWFGNDALELTYKDASGKVSNQLLYRSDESTLELEKEGIPWNFKGDASLFRLVAEARRIQLAYLFDPLLAVHTSLVEPLPHQITAVYEIMIQRQPLRFLLADDPGAGKTIMAGLLIKELMARGDLQRCLIVCPGNLVEQWQDELDRRFQLPFVIMTNEGLEASRTGNWFNENPLAICRLDKLSRNEDIQEKLKATDWDLIICDEAHKMSASYFGGEIHRTKRYKLGELLSGLCRNFLLMTATPHNGKEEDFQLFMRLLDSDRFEGGFRDKANASDPSDLMRRLLKEQLLKFDGTPLFPERRAYTVNYTLSAAEAQLYQRVTEYVRQEFNRADAIENEGRRGNVGFALTILQRRLASSPEAIYQSLRRRRERLEDRLREELLLQRGANARIDNGRLPDYTEEDLVDIEDAPDEEVEKVEEELVDRASAARTIDELRAEIETLKEIEELALKVRQSGSDRKWDELSSLLQSSSEMFDASGSRRKIIIFTEHKDTLNYLAERIRQLLGRPESVVTIHGSMSRDQRKLAEHLFTQDKDVLVLVATDAAGEGINLQRAHLMVNYDLPWNPNRIEQRFGRIHRIGQTEVCHLWNLVAKETREGAVYYRLLEKLEEERRALGGQVFDVLGRITFEDKPLRELLIEAIRYGDSPEVRERINKKVDNAFERDRLRALIEERSLLTDSLDTSKVRKIREDLERAEARRLQPYFIESFFIRAFKLLGGSIMEREPRRYEITYVPAIIRNRAPLIGTREPLLLRYERITFEKSLMTVQGKPMAAFVCPGHPLLTSVIDIVLERYRDLLRQGTIMIDDNDPSDRPRALVMLEHAIQDAHVEGGARRIVSKRLQFVELDGEKYRMAGYAPYLDYRPPTEDELALLDRMEMPGWVKGDFEAMVQEYAIKYLVPEHLEDVRRHKESLIDRTMAAVKDRLTREINYWDYKAVQLKEQELAGKVNARLNSGLARQRADELAARLQKRLRELDEERKLSPLPPVIVGAALVIPAGLLARLKGEITSESAALFAAETARVEAMAMKAVMDAERRLGYVPVDVSERKIGYDIESSIPGTGRLRFIEVKGRVRGSTTVTVTKNEILTALNKPDDFILALVEVEGEDAVVKYVKKPFQREPDFGATSVNYDLKELLVNAVEPK
ncbi:helicase-related protein [Methanocella conradii]|uniref:helicase-related protein n=1 Tax=Methanocella conradii TaxID=1175444 RepID=UPI0024B351A9|nr:helicase-related protein [Methanocella conradii]MDI6898120.1 helicase-related protein [Methanocella conradii]